MVNLYTALHTHKPYKALGLALLSLLLPALSSLSASEAPPTGVPLAANTCVIILRPSKKHVTTPAAQEDALDALASKLRLLGCQVRLQGKKETLAAFRGTPADPTGKGYLAFLAKHYATHRSSPCTHVVLVMTGDITPTMQEGSSIATEGQQEDPTEEVLCEEIKSLLAKGHPATQEGQATCQVTLVDLTPYTGSDRSSEGEGLGVKVTQETQGWQTIRCAHPSLQILLERLYTILTVHHAKRNATSPALLDSVLIAATQDALFVPRTKEKQDAVWFEQATAIVLLLPVPFLFLSMSLGSKSSLWWALCSQAVVTVCLLVVSYANWQQANATATMKGEHFAYILNLSMHKSRKQPARHK